MAFNMLNRSLLSLMHHTTRELHYLLDLSRDLKRAKYTGTERPHLQGKNIAPEVLNRYRVGDIRHCFGDISKIERTYGFKPERDMDTGMEELIAWVSRTKAPVDRSAECLAELARGKLVV